MHRNLFRAAGAALFLSVSGAVASAAPSFHSAYVKAVKAVKADADEQANFSQWSLPSVIQAGLVERGGSIFFGDTLANFRGRTLEIKQGQISYGVTDGIQLFYGKQFDLAKGLSLTSRFDDSDDYYGARVVVKRPTSTNPSAISLQFEAVRPATADVTTSGTSANFDATHNNIYSVNVEDSRENLFQLQYSDISAADDRYAHVLTASAGRDYMLGEFVKSRIQLSLVTENFAGLGESAVTDVKPVFYAGFKVDPAPWLSLEADLTVLPSGIPFAGGEYTGLSSFGIYEPGGLFNELRQDLVAFGSFRLVFHGKF
jgi:hypothetical protein